MQFDVYFWPIFWSIVGTALTALASWLTTVGINFLNQKIKDKKIARWSSAIFQIVMSAVQTVFQEFVDVLKKEGKFDEKAQKEAKERAYKIITSELTDELRTYITDNFGDMRDYLMNQIEAMIYNLKR